MITLFGATGYTGRRVARCLTRAGLPFRIAGRSAARLAELSASLALRPAQLVADVNAPETLPALLAGTRVLVNCAGPFTDLGEPILRLAALGGVHYLDITNELAYVYRVQHYDALARQTGAAIVPACAFEVAISDCVIDQLAPAGPLDSVDVVYAYANPAGVISYGTRLSGLRTYAASWLTYRNGKWVGQMPGAALRSGQLEGRRYRAISFPSAEVVTVPAHCQVRSVQAWLAVAPRWAPLLAGLMPLVNVLLRTPLGALTALSFRHLAPPPPDEPVDVIRFAIQVETEGAGGGQIRVLRGVDPYALTAEIAAYAASVLHAEDYARRGVLAPAQALDSGAFLAWLTANQGVTVSAA